MIVLDTNVVSELLRPAPNRNVTQFVSDRAQILAITTVTIHEITYGLALLPLGARRIGLTASFDEFTTSLRAAQILTLSDSAARRSGHVRAHRRAIGRPIDISDSHIAGVALDSGNSLATRNTKDFEDLGIDLINPWSY